MQKHVKLLLVLSICFLITASVMSVNAAKANLQLPHESGNKLSVKTYTSPYSITAEVAFPQPTITLTTEFQTVEMDDLLPQGAPGDPVLPAKTLELLIPMGKDVDDISIYPGRRQQLAGTYNVEYGRTPVPVGHQSTAVDQPNPEIYASSTPFPGTVFTAVAEQHLRGYKILLLTLNPVQYVPKMGQLSYFESMTVTVNLKETTEVSPLLRNLPQDREVVRSTVDNPEALQTYYTPVGTRQQPTSIVDPAETYNYVIITNELLNASFQPLVDWKTLKGFNVTTVLVEDILADPDYFVDGLFGDQNTTVAKFNDTAACMRNFIKDAYANWETEYVLLGGDTAFIPTRGTYGFVNAEDPPNPYTFDVSLPCDMYFVALDGTWNNDNDTIFGEGVYGAGSDSPQNGTAGDEADLYAELYIGRAPVTTPEQVGNFVSKTIWYENNTDDSYFKKALMFGETLDEDTEGANSKDLASDEIPQYTIKRYYSRDGTYSRNNVLNAINSGTHILNHDGHTNTETMLGLSRTDIDTYITNTEYFLGYSVGCYAAAIDADAVIEHFVKNPSGAFAFVGNSRYGWYLPGTTLGTGDQFDRKFFEILNDTENTLGKTLQASKEHFASSISSDTVRWTYYQLLILGDPSLEIVTEIGAPTAQFKTDPTASRLDPPIFRGVLTLNGTAKRGTAPGATFSNYTVDFGRGTSPTTWLTTGIELVNNGLNETTLGLLATWNTTTILPGTVTLRLTSHDPSGTIGQDWWVVKVEELPAIRVEPSLVQTQEGLSFTVTVRITKPINMWSFNFNMSWDPSLVEYVSHSVYVPQNTYYWGVLFSPAAVTHDTVDPLAGTYWIAASSSGSAEPYNRDGTVFNMTFHAIGAGTCYLDIPSSELKNKAGGQITHVRWVSTVEVGAGVHDVAVKAITPLGTLIGQGYKTKINVTIANEGTFAESFNCTVYANGTAIANFTVTALAGLAEAQYTATWTTTGWDFGDYSLSANATALDGETDLLDNSLTEGWISVTLPGDVEGDGDVDIFDIVKIAGAYGSKLGQPKYDANCDVDKDGDVDIFDVVLAANNYGRIL
jgi:hypothetical protein